MGVLGSTRWPRSQLSATSWRISCARTIHRLLYSRLGNHLLLKLLDVFWEVKQRLLEAALIAPNVDHVGTWEGHLRILQALERADGAAARAAMLAHFTGLRERLRHSG